MPTQENAEAMTISAGPVFHPRMMRLRYRLAASGVAGLLSRAIWGQFAILSASSDADDSTLRALINEAGHGFVRFYGLFAFAGPEETGEVIRPMALLVPAISLERAREFAEVCGQTRYLWGRAGTWRLIRVATGEAMASGRVDADFRVIHPTRARRPKDLRVWRLPEGPVAAHRGQWWLYCWELDHFHPPVGPPLYGIFQQGEQHESVRPPSLCDALIPLL